MAKRGTVKRKSIEQEEFVASHYRGRRSPSSGGSDTDSGDVVTDDFLFECKVTGEMGDKLRRPITAKLNDELEKITDEAWQRGKRPAMALRWYEPDHILADRAGWVDIVIKRVADDS